MKKFEIEATYTFSMVESVWAEDEDAAKEHVENLAYVVFGGYTYPWDNVTIETISEEDEYA